MTRATDRRATFWTRDVAGPWWISPPSDDPGVVFGRASFFAELLEYNLTNVTLDSGAALMFVVGDSGVMTGAVSYIGLELDAAAGQVTLACHTTTTRPNGGVRDSGNNTRVLYRGTGLLNGTSYYVTLRLGPTNYSVAWGLSASNTSASASAAATLSGAGSGRHQVNWRAFGDGTGRTRLGIGVVTAGLGLLSELRLTESTRLRPSLDPLRPPASLPPSLPAQPWNMPAVLGPFTDTVGRFAPAAGGRPPFGALQPLSLDGFVDVTKPPFQADPSGREDATVALQGAFDFARWHYLAVHIPVGRYRVTDTLLLRQTSRLMASGDIPGPLPARMAPLPRLPFTADFLLDGVSSRYVPHTVRGQLLASDPAARATFVFAPRTFTDPSSPKMLIAFHFTNPLGVDEPNAQYNAIFSNINIEIGQGNAGAVAVALRGAQGSGLEDVTITFMGGAAPDAGLAGVFGGCGSGGAHHGVQVVGGRCVHLLGKLLLAAAGACCPAYKQPSRPLCITSHCTVLHCTALHGTARYCIISRCI